MFKKNYILFNFTNLSILGIFLFQSNLGYSQSCDYVAPIQVHYLPIAEDQMYDFFITTHPDLVDCQGAGFSANNLNPNCNNSQAEQDFFDIDYPLNRYFSIGVAATGTIIYYDHWEDGYETDIENPTQGTTEIWGDGDLTNGVAPGYPTDLLTQGDVIILQSIFNGPPNVSTILTDGRDKIASSYSVTMTHFYYPTNLEGNPWPLIAGAAPIQGDNELGTNFIIPIGENSDYNQMFEHVGAFIQAGEAGATVDVDTDADGTPDVTYILAEGETAYINGGIQLGATINSDNPITVQIQGSDVCSNYGTRSFILFPDDQLSNVYVAAVGTPASGVGTGQFSNQNAQTRVFLYNPNSTAITVNWSTSSGAQFPVTIPAGGQVNVPIPNLEAAIFESAGGENFVAISTTDTDPMGVTDCEDYLVINGLIADAAITWDWGYTLVPLSQLNGQVPVVALAPGSDPLSGTITDNTAPIWFTPFHPPGSTNSGNITICVDFDGDGGPLTDPIGQGYDQQLSITPLSSNRLYDNGDKDNSGTRFWVCDGSGALISAAWGEDPNTAFSGAPSLDLGTTVVPGPSFQPTKENELIADQDGDGFLDTVVDTAEYCICVSNSGALTYTVNQIQLTDVLPTEFDYVPNSAYTLFGGIQTPIANAGSSPFPLDESGFTIPFNLNPNDIMSVCYSITLNQLLPNKLTIVNEVVATDGSSTLAPRSLRAADNVCPLDSAPVIEVIDNDCTSDTDGAINVTTGCIGGSTLEWSTDGGITWSTTQPVYDSTASSADPIESITIRARCVLDIDPTCISPETADVITVPEQCCPVENNCINQFGEFTIIKRRP